MFNQGPMPSWIICLSPVNLLAHAVTVYAQKILELRDQKKYHSIILRPACSLKLSFQVWISLHVVNFSAKVKHFGNSSIKVFMTRYSYT